MRQSNPATLILRRVRPVRPDQDDRFARITFAGIAAGLLIAAIIDRTIGGPGLLAAFGL